jgi:hypothetical protein
MNSFLKHYNLFAAITQTLRRTLTTGAGALLIVAALFAAGCHSMDKPASAGFASVLIYNQSLEKIHQATTQVFQANGYQSVPLPDGGQSFEKEATKGEQIAYAGFVGAHEGERTIVRVRMGIQPQGVNSFLLSCKAFVVTSPGSFVNEQSYALFGFQSGPYQRLLDNIKAVLQNPAATP